MSNAPSQEILAAEVKHLREIMELRFEAGREALRIQTEANSIHFDALNHEAARMAARDAHFVSGEKHDANMQELRSSLHAVQKLVYVGLGILLAAQVALSFYK